MMEQCLERAFLKDIKLTQEALTTRILSHKIVPRVERLKRNLRRHISGAENVTSSECHVDSRTRP